MLLSRRLLVVHLSLLLTVIIWGQTFVAIRYLVVRIGAPEVLFLRAGLSSLCFLMIIAFSQRALRDFTQAEWGRMALVALCGVAVNSVAQAFSQNYLTASLASLLVTCAPVFTAVLSRLLLGEALTRRKLLGITLACAGFLIVLLWGGSGASFSADRLLGIAILICAPLGWAAYTVLSKPLLARHEPHVVAGVTTVLGGLMLLPLLALEPSVARDAVQLSARGWLAAITFSVLAIVVGYTLWYRGLRELDPSQVVVYMYLVPFFGVLSSWLILGERITPWLLLGGATILSGVVVTNSGRRAVPAPPPAAVERETVRASSP